MPHQPLTLTDVVGQLNFTQASWFCVAPSNTTGQEAQVQI